MTEDVLLHSTDLRFYRVDGKLFYTLTFSDLENDILEEHRAVINKVTYQIVHNVENPVPFHPYR